MKKDGYFESKRLKLPRTSTTAELHRPLTLSLRENFEYSTPRRAVNTGRRSRDDGCTYEPPEKEKKRRKKQKKLSHLDSSL